MTRDFLEVVSTLLLDLLYRREDGLICLLLLVLLHMMMKETFDLERREG